MKYLILLIFSTWTFTLTAQGDGRMSEKEAELEKEYVEADAALFLQEFPKAVELYKEIFIRDRSNHAAAYNLARAYAGMDNMENAEKYINLAIKEAPQNKWYRLLHANMMRDYGRHEEALASYQWLANHESSNRYFVENYAFTLLKLEKVDDALLVLNQWETEQGVSEPFSKKKFEIYDNQNKVDLATDELYKLASAYPTDVRYWQNLGGYLLKHGDKEAAIPVYEHILEIEPNNAAAKLKMAEIGADNTKTASSEQLSSIISDPSVDVGEKVLILLPLITEVAIKHESSQGEQVLAMTKQLETDYQDNAKVSALRGDALYHTHHYEDAILAYKKTISQNDRVYAVWENLMDAQFQVGDYEDLTELAYDAIDLYPNEVSAYVYYAIGNIGLKKYSEADTYLAESFMISGRNNSLRSFARSGQAFRYLTSGDLTKAQNAIEDIDEQHMSAFTYHVAGDIALKQGKKADAVKLWKKAAQINPTPSVLDKIATTSI